MKYIQYFVYIIIGICLCNLILNIVIQYSPGTHIMYCYKVIIIININISTGY